MFNSCAKLTFICFHFFLRFFSSEALVQQNGVTTSLHKILTYASDSLVRVLARPVPARRSLVLRFGDKVVMYLCRRAKRRFGLVAINESRFSSFSFMFFDSLRRVHSAKICTDPASLIWKCLHKKATDLCIGVFLYIKILFQLAENGEWS